MHSSDESNVTFGGVAGAVISDSRSSAPSSTSDGNVINFAAVAATIASTPVAAPPEGASASVDLFPSAGGSGAGSANRGSTPAPSGASDITGHWLRGDADQGPYLPQQTNQRSRVRSRGGSGRSTPTNARIPDAIVTPTGNVSENLNDILTAYLNKVATVSSGNDENERLAKLSRKQVTHVAGIARGLQNRLDAANTEVERVQAIADQEKAWRETAQNQVAHVSDLARQRLDDGRREVEVARQQMSATVEDVMANLEQHAQTVIGSVVGQNREQYVANYRLLENNLHDYKSQVLIALTHEQDMVNEARGLSEHLATELNQAYHQHVYSVNNTE